MDTLGFRSRQPMTQPERQIDRIDDPAASREKALSAFR
jgi:hypothetical protein